MSKRQKHYKKVYQTNKDKKVGENCHCPTCGTAFIKTSYQQVFCKSKGGTICKDKYWNTVTPTKRNNTTRISLASYAFMNSDRGKAIINQKVWGEDAPNIVGGSGKITHITSEGYRVMDGVAYDEFDAPVYNHSPYEDDGYFSNQD